MIVSVGILAHNEERRIEGMIESLFAQSAFVDPSSDGSLVHEWEVIVVPNGCTDATAQIAREALRRAAVRSGAAVDVVVAELAQPGKSGAWNYFVHEVSRSDADVLVLCDADIRLGHEDTVRNCLRVLHDDPTVEVVVDLPVKSFDGKAELNLVERMSLRHSEGEVDRGPVGISGQFYCARVTRLREIWMPRGLPVEDGYVLGMVVTDCFRSPVDPSRIARAANATHYYEALVGPRALIRHEVRLVVGTAMNAYLMWDFLRFTTDPDGAGAGAWVRDRIAEEPDWYTRFIDYQIRARGAWVLPRGLATRRVRGLRGLGARELAKRLPVAAAAFAMDVVVMTQANRSLKTRGGVGLW